MSENFFNVEYGFKEYLESKFKEEKVSLINLKDGLAELLISRKKIDYYSVVRAYTKKIAPIVRFGTNSGGYAYIIINLNVVNSHDLIKKEIEHLINYIKK